LDSGTLFQKKLGPGLGS